MSIQDTAYPKHNREQESLPSRKVIEGFRVGEQDNHLWGQLQEMQKKQIQEKLEVIGQLEADGYGSP